MAALAAADGAFFLPNVAPEGPVDFVLVCMEPSAGRWATTPEKAKAKVAAGFRNFVSSTEDFILHFCASHYLCQDREDYHITDLSKGAMSVKTAGIARVERYDRWYDLLLQELRLILRPGADVVAVGRAVAEHLERKALPWPFTRIIHYSGQAAASRLAGIATRRHEFSAFSSSVTLSDILRSAEAVLAKARMPNEARGSILSRLAKASLSESRLALIFNYKMAFEGIRAARTGVRAV